MFARVAECFLILALTIITIAEHTVIQVCVLEALSIFVSMAVFTHNIKYL